MCLLAQVWQVCAGVQRGFPRRPTFLASLYLSSSDLPRRPPSEIAQKVPLKISALFPHCTAHTNTAQKKAIATSSPPEKTPALSYQLPRYELSSEFGAYASRGAWYAIPISCSFQEGGSDRSSEKQRTIAQT